MALIDSPAPVKRHRFPDPPPGAIVMIEAGLLLELVDRSYPDGAITIQWGNPVTPIGVWTQDLYVPTFTTHEVSIDG